MKRFSIVLILMLICSVVIGCDGSESSDKITSQQQEKMMKEQVAQLGLPAIVNNTEKAMLKMILEKRDDPKLINYLYTFSQMKGEFIYIGKIIGYPMPYSTQYTNPFRVMRNSETDMTGNATIPQADPNGLFSPASAEATWCMMINPNTNKPEIQYFEEKVNAFSYKR